MRLHHRLVRPLTTAAIAVAVVASGAAATAPPAAAATDPLQVSIAATSAADGPSFTGLIAGVVSPLTSGLNPGATASPYTFTLTCGTQTPCDTNVKVSWDFGDGAATSTATLSTTHAYNQVGTFNLTARVSDLTSSGNTYYGTASIKVLVSPRYGDVPSAQPSASPPVLARSDSEAIWAVGALKLFSPCRADLPAVDGVNPNSVLVNEGEFCPEPKPGYGPAQPPGATPPPVNSWLPTAPTAPGAAPDGTSAGPVNGVTGAACLAAAANCNLPTDTFIAADGGNTNAVCNPNPNNSGTTSATTACENQVELAFESEGLLAESSGALVVTPTNCGTGYSLIQSGSAWKAAPGVDAGCVSRGDFFSAVITALDGSPSGRTIGAAPAGCTSGPYAYAFSRAAYLGLPDTTEANASSPAACDASGPLTKAVAYQVLAAAAALPTPSSCPSGLSDMSGQPATDCSVLAAGGPLVGDTTCPSGTGTCYNPSQPVTRAESATLIASQVLGVPAGTYELVLGLTGNHSPQPVNSPVTITATASVPSWYATTDTVTINWPAPVAGTDTLTCPTTTTQQVGTAHQVVETCTYTQVHAGTTTLSVSATDSHGNTANASFATTAFNRPPIVASAGSTASTPTLTSTGGATATGTVNVEDPEHEPLSYSVCPDNSQPCGTSATVDNTSTGTASQGSVAISSTTNPTFTGPGSVTVTFTPTGNLVDGTYSFVIKGCDADSCGTGAVYGHITAITTATAQTITRTNRSAFSITLSGGSPADDPIVAYEITALPADGTLSVDTSTSGTATYSPATVGITTTDPVVQYAPTPTGPAETVTFSFATAGKQAPSTFSVPATVTINLPAA